MRRHDLDWLRVLVFALLILYHVGMFFVPWGWHIKNNVIYTWLVYPMLFLNQWRLPILFVISGMGTYYALGKRTGKQFIWERIKRLYIPLAIGMLLVVPPQVYIERFVEGQFQGSYLEFWPAEAFTGIYPEGNMSWHHLWFLPYLLLFSLILAPIFLHLRKKNNSKFISWIKKRFKSPWGLFIFVIPLYLVEALIEPFFPVTHALVGDWFAIVNYGLMFFIGFVLISAQDEFWHLVKTYRRKFLYLGILSFISFLTLISLFEDSIYVHFTEALLKVTNLWLWVLICFGYAASYLNKPSKTLAYANESVYPFYILHQTITIIIGYFLIDLSWGFFAKALVLLAGTFGISWIIYEFLLRRWTWIRPLFGLKIKSKP
ncbi:MAG: acyltransferase family protein [Eudoraea sp.]|nr:acyltransferase family protein [Eudoraea sp.]